MQDDDGKGRAFGALLVAAGIDPAGPDLVWLAKLKEETEAMIAAGRNDPAFPTAVPAFAPPDRLPPIEPGDA